VNRSAVPGDGTDDELLHVPHKQNITTGAGSDRHFPAWRAKKFFDRRSWLYLYTAAISESCGVYKQNPFD
jgi:hypothetical protein